ncbi:MAG: hypothetical protein ACREDR_06815 [Blastocatellia bacterium]
MESVDQIEEAKRKATYRRLLLAKRLYLHGLEHSRMVGALNKMIAVHNFHNAIEIVLRAIFLRYEIRAEKQLNIEFETMLSEIDSHPTLKDRGQRLPYRQEMRNLNQLRNLVQHHAHEPETSAMEELRVFASRFLIRVFEEYFAVAFDSLSSVSLVNDVRLQEILGRASERMLSSDFISSARLIRIAFEFSSSSIVAFLPNEGVNSAFFATSSFREDRELTSVIETVYRRIRQAELYTALLASGVSLADLKRLNESTPRVDFAADGTPYYQGRGDFTEDQCRWALDFVVNTIISWQLLGLDPVISENAIRAWDKAVSAYNPKDDSQAMPSRLSG